MTYKICALIPTHNHHHALGKITERLKGIGLEVYIVDDGSGEETQVALEALSKAESIVHLLRLPKNSGKGVAVNKGLRWVAEKGYTHAFQVDADGQHSLENLQGFLDLSRRNPQALLSGHPIFDATIPFARRLGRWLTHVWVWIETLSIRITDSMCGFRVYPIHKSLYILDNFTVGCRMDFDTEIMVRHFWQGTPVIMSPVKVIYPENNLSNFDAIKDNWRITKMHTRLFFSMLRNLPRVLLKRPDYKNLDLPGEAVHWSSTKERGSFLGLLFLAGCYRLLGRRICTIFGAPVILYFYITGTKQRQASHKFLERSFTYQGLQKRPGIMDGLRHYMSFLQMILDKFAAWTGDMDHNQIDDTGRESFTRMIGTGKGGVIFVSHLGNMEFCRAATYAEHKGRFHVLLHSKNAQQFNRILKMFNPQSNVDIIEVTEVGADTIIYLKDRVQLGDWVVIAADRVPVQGTTRVSYVPFLGEEAPFSQGPYILASLLECPVYSAIAVRENGKFRVFTELFTEKLVIDRRNREETLKEHAKKYASYLEYYCISYPFQWYNFFDFWNAGYKQDS